MPPSVSWFVQGEIDRRKFEDYLLNPEHPDGRHKLRLWSSMLGIGQADTDLAISLIREQLPRAAVKERPGVPIRGLGQTIPRWELVIPDFRGPAGEAPVLTAWARDPRAAGPHLTTAFPLVE